MPDTGVLLIGHGSRDASANLEFEALVAAYRDAHPELRVEVAYIELARPLLADAIDNVAPELRRLVLVPVLLFATGHVKNDLPLAVESARRRHPGVTMVIAQALGIHPLLIELAYARAASALGDDTATRAKTLLLVVGRGASDPDANGDFCKLARMVGEGRGFLHVEPTFMGITTPKLEASLQLVARLRPERLVVLPYLLFAGRLVSKLTQLVAEFTTNYPWIRAHVAAHLGAEPRLFALIDERARQALAGEAVLPCDTCQYRSELPGLANQVGGLRALLYSARHTLMHSQATLPAHLHKPLKKHVLVCVNADCVDRGSMAVLDAFRREVKRTSRAREIKVTRTGCMGRCGEGPSVAIYPDGVWYRRVSDGDASEIVHEHLNADRLVSRLVDDILH